MASESLIWHLIRDNNSFLVKRGQTKRDGSVQFSKEPGNLLSVNTFKYSGIANHKTVDLQATPKGTAPFSSVVELKKKNFKKAASAQVNSNAKSVSKITLKKSLKKGLKTVAALVGTGVGGKGKKVTYSYRPDLASAAALKLAKLKRVVDIRNGKKMPAKKASRRNSSKDQA